jgi:hypothetical protein
MASSGGLKGLVSEATTADAVNRMPSARVTFWKESMVMEAVCFVGLLWRVWCDDPFKQGKDTVRSHSSL